MQVQTLQATRRKEEKHTKDNSLTVPLKKQTGLLADVAEVCSFLQLRQFTLLSQLEVAEPIMLTIP